MYQLVENVDIDYIKENKAYRNDEFIGYVEDGMFFDTEEKYDYFLHQTDV